MTYQSLSPLLDALELDTLTPQEQERLMLDIHSLVFENSMVRIVSCMDDGTCEEFTTLVESDPAEEAIESFIRERVPDADRLVEEAVAELASDILLGTGTNHA